MTATEFELLGELEDELEEEALEFTFLPLERGLLWMGSATRKVSAVSLPNALSARSLERSSPFSA